MSVIRIIKKFRLILSRHQKIRILELTVLMIIGGFLETLSVSLVLPFMNAVMEPEKTMENQYVQMICQLFDIHSARTFLLLVAITLAVIYVLKNAFLIFQNNIQYRFVYTNQFMVQCRMFHSYLCRPYEFFLNAHSGEIMRIIGGDTGSAFTLLMVLLGLFTELIVSVFLIITVLIISPVITLSMAGILLVVVLIILLIIRPILRKASEANQLAQANMNSWLMQSFQGIKELKVMKKEPFFERKYEKNGKIMVDAIRKHNILGTFPRYFIEAVSMASLFLVLAVLIYNGQNLEELVPIVSAIAMAAIRLLPSINKITGSLANAAYMEPLLDKTVENLRNVDAYQDGQQSANEKNTKRISSFHNSFGFSNVTYHYPNSEGKILKDASIEIKKGQSVGIVGTSGAGKTTAVDILLGLLKIQNGKVVIDGTDIQLDMDGWLSQIGYIPQNIFMLDDTIRANVAFGIEEEIIDDAKVWAALEDAALAEHVRSLPDGLDTQLGERGVRLSGGQRQRIGIARALYPEPSILFFDEATSALDNETENAIMESIDRLHGTKTMVIIAHRLTTIENCDAVYRVEKGKIVQER